MDIHIENVLLPSLIRLYVVLDQNRIFFYIFASYVLTIIFSSEMLSILCKNGERKILRIEQKDWRLFLYFLTRYH